MCRLILTSNLARGGGGGAEPYVCTFPEIPGVRMPFVRHVPPSVSRPRCYKKNTSNIFYLCLFFNVDHLFVFLFTAAERILTRDDLCLEGASLTVQKAIEKQDSHMDQNDSEHMDDSGKGCDMIIYSCL